MLSQMLLSVKTCARAEGKCKIIYFCKCILNVRHIKGWVEKCSVYCLVTQNICDSKCKEWIKTTEKTRTSVLLFTKCYDELENIGLKMIISILAIKSQCSQGQWKQNDVTHMIHMITRNIMALLQHYFGFFFFYFTIKISELNIAWFSDSPSCSQRDWSQATWTVWETG